jgi:hypothetical protein
VEEGVWPDLAIEVEATPVRVPPGRYVGSVVGIQPLRVFRRRAIRLDFEVRPRLVSDPIGVVPAFFRLPAPGVKLGRSSRLARLLDLVAPRPGQLTRVQLGRLRGLNFAVAVVDVTRDRAGRELPPPQVYSRVESVLEWLG